MQLLILKYFLVLFVIERNKSTPCNNSAKVNFMKGNYYNVLYAEKLSNTIIRKRSFGTQCVKGVNDLLIDLLNDLLIKNNHLHLRTEYRTEYRTRNLIRFV